MLSNRRAWLAFKNALWWCVRSVFQLWALNPVSVIRRRHAKLYYINVKDNTTVKPRWTDMVCNILMSDAKRKAKLLKWVQRMTAPAIVDNFTDCWHDGIVLCSLLEAVSPGSCPQVYQLKPEYSKTNCQLGINLAQKYLSVQKIFANPEMIATASPETENYILHLVQMIKWRYQRLPKLPKETKPRSDLLTKVEMRHNIYEARGPGLKSAVIGKRATFTIFTEHNDSLDLNIEIRGPNNEINCEKITKLPHQVNQYGVDGKEDAFINPTDRNSTYQYMKDPQGNTVVRQRSLEDDTTNMIPFDYRFTLDGSLIIAYVPRSIGIYVIDIFSNGESIQGSPFEVTVSNWMSSWNRVTKKKLLILNSKHCVDEKDVSHSDDSSDITTASVDRPRLLRQYTVTKRRVIKRMTTRNGQEIVITDPNTSPGNSRRSSVDVVDLSEHDNPNWYKKYRHKNDHRERIDHAMTSGMHLAARPFSPDNISLCSFSRRSSGCQSDSNTSSSTDRHVETDHCDSNPDFVNTYTSQQSTSNKQAHGDTQRLNDIPPFKMVRALTHTIPARHIPTFPRRFSEGHLPKVTFSNVNIEMSRTPSPILHNARPGKTETNELELTKVNPIGQHGKSTISSEPLIVEDNKENNITDDHSVLHDHAMKLSFSDTAKVNEDLTVIPKVDVLNDRRPHHTFKSSIIKKSHYSLKLRKPKEKADKSTQVSSDEIKSETNWGRHGIKRRRRIPCSSEEDKVRKIKEYRLKRARRKHDCHVFDQNTRISGRENSRQLSNESERPHSHIHRWLQNNHRVPIRTPRQSTGDSGIADECTLVRQIKADAQTPVEAPTDDQDVFTSIPIHQDKEQSVEVWNLKENHSIENGSSKSISFSDSELQCGASVLKQKRKMFASTKSNGSSKNIEGGDMFIIPKTTYTSTLTIPELERKHSFTKVKAHSVPKSASEDAVRFIEITDKKNVYRGSDSDLAITNRKVKRKCRLHSRKHSYKHNRHRATTSVSSDVRDIQQQNEKAVVNIPLETKYLVIHNEHTHSDKGKKSPSSSSTDELYDGFGVLSHNRHDLLGEIKAFQNLGLNTDTKNTPCFVRHSNNKNGDVAVLTNGTTYNHFNTHQDTRRKDGNHSITHFKQNEEKSSHFRHQIRMDEDVNKVSLSKFKFSEHNISADTDSSVQDVLSLNTIHDIATDDDERASVDASEECLASGSGLEYGYVGIQNNFQVWVEDPDVGNLMVGVRGPRQHCVTETCMTYTGDSLYEITYSVTLPGMYIISVKWKNKPIHNSPFIVKITPIDDDAEHV